MDKLLGRRDYSELKKMERERAIMQAKQEGSDVESPSLSESELTVRDLYNEIEGFQRQIQKLQDDLRLEKKEKKVLEMRMSELLNKLNNWARKVHLANFIDNKQGKKYLLIRDVGNGEARSQNVGRTPC